ncbi:uncharacterized protein SPPG_02748 [Spizellomyces punctatus DAOM BR117]|uniref:BTB domain-containing protein n=1 Tax=Spizellomyces punctatus (strain DAOM BR117) TaxID=645134 RepID=A0A0L0HMW7_SPIPD|nr:uncharacterized protein SPPG_02748 [Spizellomyces punctatus DAOM BR117]KND02270.1 hypothetical protein SPPG_02748 [Spizellomyces punctatus DAOM BR117]|eukprot:XP_016610309.1 hypothetical protein SPPG_02748 [Spizellomyces punctatus DAOM BR117]
MALPTHDQPPPSHSIAGRGHSMDDQPENLFLPFVYGPPSRSGLPWSTLVLYALATVGILSLFLHLSGGRQRKPSKSHKRRRKVTKQVVPTPTGGLADASEAQLTKLVQVEEEEETESDEDETPRRDYGKVVGDTLTNAMVNGAVLLKRSPIPDLLASMTGYGLEGYKRVNNAFNVEEKMVKASQKAVSAGIQATGIFAHAAIKAGLAYQMAPGRREKVQRLAIREGTDDEDKRVKVVRIIENAVPGSIPPPVLVDVSTQTDEDLVNGEATGPATATGGVSSVLASYLASSLRVAGNVATASSEVVLGKDRTLKLLGVDPIEARRNPDAPEDGNVRYINVGGILYATTLETLTAAEGSLLAEWFGDESKRASLEIKDGSYFLDRDGTHFRHILNYLRGLPTHDTMSGAASLKQLLLEAEFYRLPDLADDVARRITEVELEEQSVMELVDKLVRRVIPGGISGRAVLLAGNALLVATAIGILWLY